MLGILTDTEIRDLLNGQLIGRIGCHADGSTYVVPVNYLFDGTDILAHSGNGLKIAMMRKNPEVCFEVDDIKSVVSWKSAVLQGTFQEIVDIRKKEEALQKLINRVVPFLAPDSNPSHGITADEYSIGDTVELVIYKIVIKEMTGRFEKH